MNAKIGLEVARIIALLVLVSCVPAATAAHDRQESFQVATKDGKVDHRARLLDRVRKCEGHGTPDIKEKKSIKEDEVVQTRIRDGRETQDIDSKLRYKGEMTNTCR